MDLVLFVLKYLISNSFMKIVPDNPKSANVAPSRCFFSTSEAGNGTSIRKEDR